MKKTLATFLIFVSVLHFSFFQAPKAHALDLDDVFNTLHQIWVSSRDTVIIPAAKQLANQLLDKTLEQTLNWATNGFDGEPGFINNWDGFLKDTQHDVISGSLNQANAIAQKTFTDLGGTGSFDNITDYASLAQKNYGIKSSGKLDATRSVVASVASFGARELNIDPLSVIIGGNNETLSKITGSEEAKEAAKTDISVAGWDGYIAFADPHNTELGVQSLVTGALSNKVNEETENTIDNVQTPQKFLDKKECLEYRTLAGGSEECIRYETTTPGSVVAGRVNQVLGKEYDLAVSADGLEAVLLRALNKLTTSLIDNGLNSLYNKVESVFGENSNSNNFNSVTQSDYDVLGVSGGSTSNLGGGTRTVNRSTGGALQQAPDGIHRGFPEVEEIRPTLEEGLENTNAILETFDEVGTALRGITDSVKMLDRCIPGPDHGWEQRQRELFDFSGDEGALNTIGLNQTKRMIGDSRINIPGATVATKIIEDTIATNTNESLQNEILKRENEKILRNITDIRDLIEKDFNFYKNQISDNLVLFSTDWENLSEGIQINLLELAETEGFIVIKRNQGETAEGIVQDQNIRAREAVLTMAWDLWETEKSLEPESVDADGIPVPDGETQISDIRYTLSLLAQTIPIEGQVVLAQKNRDNALSDTNLIKNYAEDCITLKSYVSNLPKDRIRANLLNPSDALPVEIVFGQGDNDKWGTVSFVKVDGFKTDAEILTYLNTEKLKQDNRIPSELITNLFTQRGNVESSILGFDSGAEKDTYFRDNYDDSILPHRNEMKNGGSLLGNAKSIAELYQKDNTFSSFGRGGQGNGILFCRTQVLYDSRRDSSGEKTITNCVKPWYKLSNLGYEVIFEGI